jgi:hypothetical protein
MASHLSHISPRRLRVFLCHASEDKPTVREIYQRLQLYNMDLWFDEKNLLPGERWEQVIPDVIRRCDIVLICLSQTFLLKEGYGNYEIHLVLEAAKKKPVDTIFHIPYRLDDCVVPSYLEGWHYVSNFIPGDFEKLIAACEKRRAWLNTNHGANIEPLRDTSSEPPADPFFHRNSESVSNTPSAALRHFNEGSRETGIPVDDTSIPSSIDQRIKTILAENALVDHTQLFGVEEFIKDVGVLLSASSGSWLMSLFGEGGLGKTALAYEVVSRYSLAAGFTRVAWVSAKSLHLSLDGMLLRNSSAEFRWASLIKKMADQLGIALGYNAAEWMGDFQQQIRVLPRSEKCLLVIDNLETVEDVTEAIQYICGNQIIKPHKILVTTRHALLDKAPSVVEKEVTSLNVSAALDFIRSIGNNDIERATDDELRPVVDATEGNPLLIKLCVRRFLTSRLPLSFVLGELQEVHKHLGKRIIDYLYTESLSMLQTLCGEDAAQSIMNAFCPMSSGEAVAYNDLFIYSGIADRDTFHHTLGTACNLGLIRTSRLNATYSIHSLLWKFVCDAEE